MSTNEVKTMLASNPHEPPMGLLKEVPSIKLDNDIYTEVKQSNDSSTTTQEVSLPAYGEPYEVHVGENPGFAQPHAAPR